MRSPYRLIVKIGVLATIALTASYGMGATLINQNFDNTTDFPANAAVNVFGNGTTVGRWAPNDGITPLPTTIADPAPSHLGDQAVRIQRNGGGITGLLGYRSDDAFSSGIVGIQYSVYRESANSSLLANVENVGVMQDNFPLGILISADGTLNSMASDKSGYVDRGVTIPQSTWTKIEFIVDLATKKYDLFTTIGAGSRTQVLDDYPYHASLGSLNAFAFIPSGTLGSTTLVDDVLLASPPVPEPAAAGLLLLGGVISAFHRRRS